MLRRPRLIAFWALLLGLLGPALRAHDLTITEVTVSFDQPGILNVKFDIDLDPYLPSVDAYYALTIAPPDTQSKTINGLLPAIVNSLQPSIGDQRLSLIFQGFTLPKLSRADFDDPATDKFTTLRFIAVLPASQDYLHLVVPYGNQVQFPVAFTVQIPSAHVSQTSWLEDGDNDSAPFNWASLAPRAGAVSAAPAPSAQAGSAAGPAASPAATEAPAHPVFDVDTMPWYRQLGMYLRLGFHHIVPEGTDHILFVLGLFFLGITWRKLLFQTTTFTVAHATTLFLSVYGIFSLPSRYVEPAIALSIAFIALENVFHPKLGPGRLAVVFSFGLIHGLGFASSLAEVPFPKHQFIVALLGFNFGVDFGQLFVISLAFLAVGWWRNRPWFRPRIAIPCSFAIAAIGIFWAIQRVIFYRAQY
jgi:hypothetical protein